MQDRDGRGHALGFAQERNGRIIRSRPIRKEDDMLIITLKIDDAIVIGDGITVKLLSVRPDRVRLGFATPPGVPVHRKEVYDAIHRKDGVSEAAAPKSADEESA